MAHNLIVERNISLSNRPVVIIITTCGNMDAYYIF